MTVTNRYVVYVNLDLDFQYGRNTRVITSVPAYQWLQELQNHPSSCDEDTNQGDM